MNCMKKRKKTTEREKILNRITFRKILISFSTTLHRGLRINICEITNYEHYKLSNLKWDWIRAIRRSRRDWSLDPSQSALKKTLLSMQILWRKATLFWAKHSNSFLRFHRSRQFFETFCIINSPKRFLSNY